MQSQRIRGVRPLVLIYCSMVMAYGHCARVPGPGLNCAEIHVDLTTGSLSDDRLHRTY